MPKAQPNIQPKAHIFYYFQCGTQAFSPLIITSSSEYITHQFLIHFMLFFQQSLGWRLGMTTEQDGAKGKGLCLRPTWFCLTPFPPYPIRWRKFSYLIPTPWDPAKPRPTP